MYYHGEFNLTRYLIYYGMDVKKKNYYLNLCEWFNLQDIAFIID